MGVCSSVVEHEIADLRVAGSIPVAPWLLLLNKVAKQRLMVIRVSLVGQDTWFSPRRPGFESRTRNGGCWLVWCVIYIYIYIGLVGEKPWRNGSASDSRPEGWGFKSLWLQIVLVEEAGLV